jgi:hypothetical protein
MLTAIMGNGSRRHAPGRGARRVPRGRLGRRAGVIGAPQTRQLLPSPPGGNAWRTSRARSGTPGQRRLPRDRLITELVQQLRGEASDRQLPDPGVALVHTTGGTILELEANACTVGV